MPILMWDQWINLWNLYHKVTFDGHNKLILINYGETSIDVQEDLYSAWKQWVVQYENGKWPPVMRSVGGDPLPGSRELGSTYFLMNGWKIRTWEGNHRLIVEGNLYCEDGSSPFIPTLLPWSVTIMNTVSNLVESSIQQLPEIEYASFNGGVSIDIIHGRSGTAYPVGTPSYPVDNLEDAIVIANERGFRTLMILEPMTLADSVITNFTLVGRSNILTQIVLEDSLRCAGITINNCYIDGILDGGTRLINCQIGDVSYINGNVENCSLNGTIILAGADDALFSNCRTGNFTTNGSVINMGGSGQNVMLTDWSGAVTFTNSNGSDKISVQIDGGKITLDPSIAGSNMIGLNGVGLLEDNATSYATLTTDGLMNKQTIATAVGDEIGQEIQYTSFSGGVTIDVINGTDGIIYPIGTPLLPCKTIQNAVTIGELRGFNTLRVIGNITLDVDSLPYYLNGVVIGQGPKATTVTMQNSVLEKCVFRECTLQGTFGNGSSIETYICTLKNLYNITLEAHDCTLAGTIELNNSDPSQFFACKDGIPGYGCPVIEVNDCASLGIWGYSGGIRLTNITTPDAEISVNFESGRLVIDATDTEGTVIARGAANIEGISGGTVIDSSGLINQSLIAKSVWDTQTINVSAANSIGILLKAMSQNALTEADIAEIQANLEIINAGIKKASKLIPHNQDLA